MYDITSSEKRAKAANIIASSGLSSPAGAHTTFIFELGNLNYFAKLATGANAPNIRVLVSQYYPTTEAWYGDADYIAYFRNYSDQQVKYLDRGYSSSATYYYCHITPYSENTYLGQIDPETRELVATLPDCFTSVTRKALIAYTSTDTKQYIHSIVHVPADANLRLSCDGNAVFTRVENGDLYAYVVSVPFSSVNEQPVINRYLITDNPLQFTWLDFVSGKYLQYNTRYFKVEGGELIETTNPFYAPAGSGWMQHIGNDTYYFTDWGLGLPPGNPEYTNEFMMSVIKNPVFSGNNISSCDWYFHFPSGEDWAGIYGIDAIYDDMILFQGELGYVWSSTGGTLLYSNYAYPVYPTGSPTTPGPTVGTGGAVSPANHLIGYRTNGYYPFDESGQLRTENPVTLIIEEWEDGVNYEAGDVVILGYTYTCVSAHLSSSANAPPSEYWSQLLDGELKQYVVSGNSYMHLANSSYLPHQSTIPNKNWALVNVVTGIEHSYEYEDYAENGEL